MQIDRNASRKPSCTTCTNSFSDLVHERELKYEGLRMSKTQM